MFFSLYAHPQKASTLIRTFSNKNSTHKNQELVISQTGILYLANADGVWSFNGVSWSCISLPGLKKPNCLFLSRDKFLYVGSKDEFGCFYINQKDEIKYFIVGKSFSQTINLSIGDVISCMVFKNKIYFLTKHKLYIFDQNKIIIKNSSIGGEFQFLGRYNQTLYLMEKGKGLFLMKNDIFKLINTDLKNIAICGVEEKNDTLKYIYTSKGVYEVNQNVTSVVSKLSFLDTANITSVKITKSRKYIATANSGLFVLDENHDSLSQISEINGHKIGPIKSIAINKVGGVCLLLDSKIHLIQNVENVIKNQLQVADSSVQGKVKIHKILDLKSNKNISLRNVYLSSGSCDLRFYYSFSAFEKFYDIKWYVKLIKVGRDGVWQKMNEKQMIDFKNLEEGNYFINVKAERNQKKLGESNLYFSISPPWFWSSYAKILYVLLFFEGLNRIRIYYRKYKQNFIQKTRN